MKLGGLFLSIWQFFFVTVVVMCFVYTNWNCYECETHILRLSHSNRLRVMFRNVAENMSPNLHHKSKSYAEKKIAQAFLWKSYYLLISNSHANGQMWIITFCVDIQIDKEDLSKYIHAMIALRWMLFEIHFKNYRLKLKSW